jgi:acetylcholinesterase/cholinesterase
MCTPHTSEDCLYLNIYTPNASASANLPVIMFMHGGNYVGGSGGVPIYDGSVLAKTQNVVVVTVNYRLGIFGAFYNPSAGIMGNFQTQDQRQAMRWIKKSIRGFGGNPKNLTITGQSAGAFSVATHLTSPLSTGLFTSAIIVSNPLSLLAATPAMATTLGESFGTKLGCYNAWLGWNTTCLRSANSSAILAAQTATDYFPWPTQILALMMQWVPVVDGTDELPIQPMVALTTGNYTNRVPTLFGTVANESVQFIYDLSHTPMGQTEYYLLLDTIFGAKAGEVDKIYGALPPQYYNDSRPFISVLATDYIFYCPNRMAGRAMTKLAPTYMYYFDKVSSFNGWTFEKVMPWCVDVVCHASDLPYIFNPFQAPMNVTHRPVPTPDEANLIKYIQTVWGNFAHTGNPNSPSSLPNVQFERFTEANILVNESTPVLMLDNYRGSYCDFWDKMGYNRY